MSEFFQSVIACCFATAGTAFAVFLVLRMRTAEKQLRKVRLAALDLRIRLRTRELNATLVAENAKLVGKGIDQGSLYLETGHRVVSEVTFGLLQLFPATRGRAQQIKETHNAISEGIYGAFREINKHVGGTIAEGLKQAHPRVKRPKKTTTTKLRSHIEGRKKRG